MTKEIAIADVDERTRKVIWKGMTTKSVTELSELTGLTRENVITIRNSMLEAVDALTIDQERQKIMVELHQVAERAKEEFESTQDARSKAPLLSAHISAMKLLLTQLKELEKSGNSQVESLNELRRNELVALMNATVNNGVMDLAAKYDWSTEETQEVFAVFNDRLAEEARKMDARNES